MEVLDKKSSTTPPLFRWSYLALILVLVAGCVYLFRENHRLAGINSRLEERLTGEQVAVFFIKPQDTDFKIKPVLYKVKAGQDMHIQALQVLFTVPVRDSKLIGIFPKGTKVLDFSLKNGLATVNLNNRATHLNAGSTLEALAVASIVNTLTKFPDVYRVKILIEGKEVESLAGHVDLTGELHYNDRLVDPAPEE